MQITEIWRYPVKSMLGEGLREAVVGPGGLEGDRGWAVVDSESGVSLSAKRYAQLLQCQAWTDDGEVMIRLPDHREFPASSTEVAAGLAELLGRQVEMRSAENADKIVHEFPTAISEGEGEPFLFEPQVKSFFDSSPFHLLTTATMQHFSGIRPESQFHRARFRPNFVAATDGPGFVENAWVGQDLLLGEIRFQVPESMHRCVMTSHAQSELPRDMSVIKTILQNNEGNAGIKLQTSVSGLLRCGDSVEVCS